MRTWFSLLLALLAVSPAPAQKAHIKDLASVEGVRDNQLVGYGIVVGLNGTGDRRQTIFSAQSLTNILARMGVSVPSTAIRVANTAAVMVTANLPPFAQPGGRIDITVSAIGDATSIQGGTLILSPLLGTDGQVFALAQGSVVLGGFSTAAGGSSKTLNHPTAGRIPNGAIVERPAPSVVPTGRVRWQLRRPDFTTATRIADAINQHHAGYPRLAQADTPGTVVVAVPSEYRTREATFIAELETLSVETAQSNRVVINERTGTIVLGSQVTLSPATVLHGPLVVEIQTNFVVSQPGPLSQGQTQVVPEVSIKANEEKAKAVSIPRGATVEQLARALGTIGATARDIIAILQSLKAAGALDAEVEVI